MESFIPVSSLRFPLPCLCSLKTLTPYENFQTISEESLPWLQLGEEKFAEVVRQSRRRSVAVSHHAIKIVSICY